MSTVERLGRAYFAVRSSTSTGPPARDHGFGDSMTAGPRAVFASPRARVSRLRDGHEVAQVPQFHRPEGYACEVC